MTDGRFVVVTLARPRRRWSAEVARWSTSGAAPIEIITCMSADEVVALVGSGRQLSALLADAGAPRVDRELFTAMVAAGVAPVVVDDGRVQRDWDTLGAVAVVEDSFALDELLDVLARCSRAIVEDQRRSARARVTEPTARRTTMVAVTGPGGAGASTVAMCIAQSLAASGPVGSVALVDGVRRSDLAMYHDVGDIIPGLPELVDAHRVDTIDPTEVRRLLFTIEERRYDVLLGLRRPRDWVSLRSGSVAAAFDGLRRSYDAVVLDVDPDLEGEDDTGSIDIEDRHCMSHLAALTSDLVVVVGLAGLNGLHDLVRLIDELVLAGVPPQRILPVVNRAPRRPTSRSSTASALGRLAHVADGEPTRPPVQLPTCRRLEQSHHQVGRLPAPLCRPLGRAVRQLLLDCGPRDARPPVVATIAAGDLGVVPDGVTHHHGEVA